MSKWVSELLVEWRQRFAPAPLHDRAPSGEPDDAERPLHALELLREHIQRGGIALRLSEGGGKTAPAADSMIDTITALPPVIAAPEEDGGAGREPRFGFGRRAVRAPQSDAAPASPRLVPLGLPRLPAHSVRERAREDAAALRAEIAQLREALADLLVENRQLKDRLRRDAQKRAP